MSEPTKADPYERIGGWVRQTHPYGFRSGQWAEVVWVEMRGGSLCFAVEFPDGQCDHWVVDDPTAGHEFSDIEPAEATSDAR